jgi:hypothetical protein
VDLLERASVDAPTPVPPGYIVPTHSSYRILLVVGRKSDVY